MFTFSPQFTKVTHKAPDNEFTVKMHTAKNGCCPDHPAFQIKQKRLFRRTIKRSCPDCAHKYEDLRPFVDDLSSTVDKLRLDNLKLRETVVELWQMVENLRREGNEKKKGEVNQLEEQIQTLIEVEKEQTKLIEKENKSLEIAVAALATYRSHIVAPNVEEMEMDENTVDNDVVENLRSEVGDTMETIQDYPGGTVKIKIATLGDSSVGKTSVINVLVNGIFNPKEVATVGNHSAVKTGQPGEHCAFTVDPVSGSPLEVTVWDTTGQEVHRSIPRMLYRGTDLALLVFDVTKSNTLGNLRNWVDDVRLYAPPNIMFLLAGNKVDMDAERVVEREAAEKFAKEIGAVGYFEISAKNDDNIDAVFEYAIQKVTKRNRLELARRMEQKKRLDRPSALWSVAPSLLTQGEKLDGLRSELARKLASRLRAMEPVVPDEEAPIFIKEVKVNADLTAENEKRQEAEAVSSIPVPVAAPVHSHETDRIGSISLVPPSADSVDSSTSSVLSASQSKRSYMNTTDYSPTGHAAGVAPHSAQASPTPHTLSTADAGGQVERTNVMNRGTTAETETIRLENVPHESKKKKNYWCWS